MNKQRVSIAMCTYNGARHIQEQLDSIAAQTRLPDELVVCDDIASDSTVEIVKSFISKVSFPVRLYINEENLGIWKNKEKAISLCTGDVIFLSDWDDVWKPNKIDKILAAFAKRPTLSRKIKTALNPNEVESFKIGVQGLLDANNHLLLMQ